VGPVTGTRLASVILVDPRGWLLLQERDEHPAIDPERWGFVGGHVEDGEDFEAGAYRELEEETGVRLDPGTLTLWREYRPRIAARPGDVRMQVWVAATDLTDDDVACHEGRQIVFVDPARAPGLELGGSPSLILPEFLGSTTYARMTG
jgi:8-oxo-dGTP pyrophosphatase MutT (NUDIX family)